MLNIVGMFGGLGPPEIIIIFLVLVLLAAPVLLIIYFVSKSGKKNQALDHTKRLKELEKMRQQGLISEKEFEEKRQQIIEEI